MPFHPGRLLRVLLCSLLLVSCGSAGAQGDFALRVWETDEGLSHNGVNAVIQGSDGFLWLATQSGVVRFDGLNFRKIRSPLLMDEKTYAIRTIIELRPGLLLFAHDTSGLLRLENDRVSIDPLSAQIPEGQRIAHLFRENDDAFWVVFANRDAWRCAAGKVEHFACPAEAGTVWPISLACSSDGKVYLGRGKGVEVYLDGQLLPLLGSTAPTTIGASHQGAIWIADATSVKLLAGTDIRSVVAVRDWTGDWPPHAMMEDRAGNLWVGTRNQGVFRWDGKQLHAAPASYPRINGFAEDDEENVWIATAGGGLNRLQRPRFHFIREETGVLSDIVGSICEDANGEMWFGNRNCFGQVRDGRLEIPSFVDSSLQRIVPLCPDQTGNLWLAATSRLALCKPRTSEPPKWMDVEVGTIHAIFPARDGSIWVAGETGPLVRFTGDEKTQFGVAQGYTSSRAQAIGESSDRELWVGTEHGEVFRLHHGNFVRYGSEAGLPASAIRAIHGDTTGNVWIATGGRGLFVWTGDRFSGISELQGLPDDTISQILEDDFGSLWFGSSRCLFKVRKTELLDCAAGRIARVQPIVFGRGDGVAGFSAAANYQPSAWKSRDGRLWFATRKGLVVARPDAKQSSQPGPNATIESFTADGMPVNLSAPVIPSSTGSLEFHFTAPAYTASERIRFRHRLEGFDRAWIETGTQRTASYSQLPPGRYVFRVNASNSDLVWSPVIAMQAIEVTPAWWETWWARGAAVALVCIGLILLVRYWSHRRLKARLLELENRRRIDLERSRIARDLHDSLGASLTQAGMLAEELCEDCHDVTEMKEHSTELAERVRAIARDLDAAVWAVSPKNDTLASLAAYLCQFALEFFRDSSTRCRVHMADDIPPIPLSPETRHHVFLTAREAMNNVLKHARATEVRITLRFTRGEFEMLIEDDGCGFPARVDATKRHGLQNMRGRILEIGGEFEVQSTEAGTSLRILVPIANAPRPELQQLTH